MPTAQVPPDALSDTLSARDWHRRVVGSPGKPCAVCGTRRATEGHHVVTRQQLRRIARGWGIDPRALIYSEAAGIALCQRCHARHTSATQRIPLSKLSPANLRFADALGLRWWIERFYPTPEGAHDG